VSFGDWDAEKVRRFRLEHPELEPFWPDVDGVGSRA
jgi:hypothetical protein